MSTGLGISKKGSLANVCRVAASAVLIVGLAAPALASISIGATSVPFIDISGTGNSIGAISDDSETTIPGATLGFGGNYLLGAGNSIRIGNNGGILFGNSPTDTFTGATDVGYYNAGPNNSTTPAGSQLSIGGMLASNTSQSGNGAGLRQFLCPLWDDYTPVTGGLTTSIRWQLVGNDLVIQWNREDAFAASGTGDVTFQAIIRNSGPRAVDFVYQDTVFAANQYQNDGGSATIGYKNWGIIGGANDVEYGIGGGGTSATSDPAFNGLGMQPKVGGWATAANGNLTHSVSITPEPTTIALLTIGGLGMLRRRRSA